MTRSAGLLARCAEDLAAAAGRPLLCAMAEGTVTDAVFSRYLAIEGRFVGTAVRLVEMVLADEADPGARVELTRIHADLVGPQTRYFTDLADRTAPGPDGCDPLSEYALGLADRHGASAVAVCLSAAETLYASWCSEASARDIVRAEAVQQWIDLHATTAFGAQAAFWRSLVDRIPIAEADDATLDDWFAGMLAAENAFHDLPLEEHA